ncbi:MAG: TIGR01212 family radical SAM protein, partial [Oscillospiraceae bacterium]
SYREFLTGYELLKSRGINICVHIINGLPGETKEMMLDTIREAAVLHPHGIKIHLLHVLAETPLAKSYLNGDFRTLELDEYVDIVCDQLELLPADVVIARVTGDGGEASLIAPL